MNPQWDELVNENDRLRAALTLIATCDEDASAKEFPIPRDEMIAIAKAALAPRTPEGSAAKEK